MKPGQKHGEWDWKGSEGGVVIESHGVCGQVKDGKTRIGHNVQVKICIAY